MTGAHALLLLVSPSVEGHSNTACSGTSSTASYSPHVNLVFQLDIGKSRSFYSCSGSFAILSKGCDPGGEVLKLHKKVIM